MLKEWAGVYCLRVVLLPVNLLARYVQRFVPGVKRRAYPAKGFSIQEIKIRATGSGKANKEAIISACNAEFGTDFDVKTYTTTGVDNIADSSFVCALGLDRYSRGFPERNKET